MGNETNEDEDLQPEWQVTIPITGKAYWTGAASSREEAIRLALDSDLQIEEWMPVQTICTGNVFNGMINNAEAEEI